MRPAARRPAAIAALLAVAALIAGSAVPHPLAADGPAGPPMPVPAPLPVPETVTLVGTFLAVVSGGACEAWDALCPAAGLEFVALDHGVWATRLVVPAGTWRYRVALGHDLADSYGTGTRTDGPDRVLQLASERAVTFVFDAATRSVADSVADPLAFAVSAGDDALFGCGPARLVPAVEPCLANVLTDPDGDGVATVSGRAGPGSHRVWVAFAGEGEGAAGPPLAPLEVATATDGETVSIAVDLWTRTATAWAGDGRPAPDGRLDPLGFGHDSHDPAYRAPAGAVPAGTAVRLRFRTFHGDATAVSLVVHDDVANDDALIPMVVEAAGIACGEAVPDARASCDWWAATVTPAGPTTLAYRFEVADGAARRYYADETVLDGGRGAVSRVAIDAGWTITAYVPGFAAVPWLAGAVVYQVFPDRFANGDPANDGAGGRAGAVAARYGWPPDEVDRDELRRWLSDLPESPGRGRDWFGGDLAGIENQLDRLADLGVEVLYLNPIFSAASNHGYDTRDYRTIDPRFGTEDDWRSLVAAARAKGIRIVLDGVFNHVSSDSPYFDRYGHYGGVAGACESIDSPYRDWFVFRAEAGGPCAGPDGPNTTTYESWSGYASLPVLRKDVKAVRDLVYAADDAVAREWLRAGASGWRLDVMMDPSFGADFWQAFRAAVKAVDPEAAIVGELWTRDEVLPKVRGDTADTTMSYRFRNAVSGYLGTVDQEGFPDAGESEQPPSVLVAELLSIREDYPDAVYWTALNLLDSHDTERILWSLTPGDAPADKVAPANLAVGTARLRLASLLQLTLPGAPTIYYGDEVGMTGADDPDDRRPFALLLGGPGRDWVAARDDPATWRPVRDGYPDASVWSWYRSLVALRRAQPVLRDGDVRFLLADDRARTLAYSRFLPDGTVAIVALNPDRARAARLEIPVGDARGPGVSIPEGTRLRVVAGDGGGDVVVSGRSVVLDLPALGGAVLVPAPGQDLAPPPAPADVGFVDLPGGTVTLAWAPADGVVARQVWRSPLAGGSFELVATVDESAAGWSDRPGPGTWHYLVRVIDVAGNVSPPSAEVAVTVAAARPAPAGSGAAETATPAPAGDGGGPPGAGAVIVLLALAAAAAALGLLALVVRARRPRRDRP